jgi:hypothetical protein
VYVPDFSCSRPKSIRIVSKDRFVNRTEYFTKYQLEYFILEVTYSEWSMSVSLCLRLTHDVTARNPRLDQECGGLLLSGRAFTSNHWPLPGTLKVYADTPRKTAHRLTNLKGLRYEYEKINDLKGIFTVKKEEILKTSYFSGQQKYPNRSK